MSTNKKVRSVRPIKIFMLDQIIKNTGLLDAAIIGDLFYWIAKGEKPWRNYNDYAQLFNVSIKTIQTRSSFLTEDLRYLSRTRTRMNNGHLGAYKYASNATKNSKVLKGMYIDILNNSSINRDYGEFDPNCQEYKEIPNIQLLLPDTIQLTNCYKQAYLLDRISWALVARCQDQLYFKSKQHFDNWTSLGDKTGRRLLEKLDLKGLTYSREEDGQFIVAGRQDTTSYEFFTIYMDDEEEARKAGVIEAVT